MNKYTQYLESAEGRQAQLEIMLAQVSDRKFEEAFGTAMKIEAMKEIKFALLRLDKDGQ